MSNTKQSIKENFIDIIPYCFDLKMILIQAIGVLLSGFITALLSTIASKIEIIQIFVKTIGSFVAYIPVVFAMSAASLMFLIESENENELTIRKSLSIIKKRLYPMFFAMFQLFGSIFCVYFLIVAFNALARIPYVGELLWPLFYLPNFLLALVVLSIVIVCVMLLHTLPASLVVFTDETKVIKRIYLILKNSVTEWLPVFLVSTAFGLIIISAHYVVSFVQNQYSRIILDEKFYKLIIAIPTYPGYLLQPWTKPFLPFDYPYTPNITYTIGGFLWGMVMYIVLCLITALILNVWNCVGSYYIYSKRNYNIGE